MDAEIDRLRRCMSDLSDTLGAPSPSLPGARNPQQVVGNLLDELLGLLDLDLVYIRLDDSESPIAALRTAQETRYPLEPRELVALVEGASAPGPLRAKGQVADGDISIVFRRLGLRGDMGLLVAGSPRFAFPDAREDRVIDAAANLAAIALLESRLRRDQKIILDTIPHLVGVQSATGAPEHIHREVLAYTGKSEEELKTWAMTDLVHPEDRARAVETGTVGIASGAPYDITYRMRRFDGVYRWFYARHRPQLGTDGRILRWFVTTTDVDDRMRADETLGKLRSDLARMSRISSLGVLSAAVAHEINQPLTGIMTNASTCLRMLAANPPHVDGALEVTRRTLRDGNRAAEVVARLHALFSGEAAKREPVDLNEAAAEVVALILGDLRRRSVAIRTDFAAPSARLTADRVQLQQVILNLLLNASDAMNEVNDRPRLIVMKTESDGANIRLSVQDVGAGLGIEDVERLFQPFYTTKGGGMGVGLSVSRSIIESHNGRLWCLPNEGPGATFAFSIPADA